MKPDLMKVQNCLSMLKVIGHLMFFKLSIMDSSYCGLGNNVTLRFSPGSMRSQGGIFAPSQTAVM